MGRFKDLLASQDNLILHGALGTELEYRGYDVSGKLWSAKYLLENPRAKIFMKPICEQAVTSLQRLLTRPPSQVWRTMDCLRTKLGM